MRTRIGTFLLATALVVGIPATGAAQNADEQAVMVAAALWAQDRLPEGSLRLDPHRTGRGVGSAIASRVARALGADVATLEDTRRCTDLMRPETCELESVALLAIAAPQVRGDQASVKVYAWYRQSSSRAPVAEATWDVRLRRTGSGWAVVPGSS